MRQRGVTARRDLGIEGRRALLDLGLALGVPPPDGFAPDAADGGGVDYLCFLLCHLYRGG